MNNVDHTKKSFPIISLCTGIRGIEKGIDKSMGGGGIINTVAYVEIEAFIIANLVAQMESGLLDAAPIWTDIKTFNAKPFRNKVFGIIGGYPCQPFSKAGKRAGINDDRHLYPYIHGFVELLRPGFVFFENVPGHISMGYTEVRKSLQGIGYAVEEGIFSASEVGAPHKRERLFILGIRDRESLARLANAIGKGLEIGKIENARSEFQAVERGSRFGFPAKRGCRQHEYEFSRTIKSGMEYTVNGYNFTADLHRAIGNSVVEQSAELAFKILIQKHINHE